MNKAIYTAAFVLGAFAANKAVAQRSWKQETPTVKSVTGLPSGQSITLKDSAGIASLRMEAWNVMGIEGDVIQTDMLPYDEKFERLITTHSLYGINGVIAQRVDTSYQPINTTYDYIVNRLAPAVSKGDADPENARGERKAIGTYGVADYINSEKFSGKKVTAADAVPPRPRAWQQVAPTVKTMTGLPTGQKVTLTDSAGNGALRLEDWNANKTQGEILEFALNKDTLTVLRQRRDANGVVAQNTQTSLMKSAPKGGYLAMMGERILQGKVPMHNPSTISPLYTYEPRDYIKSLPLKP